MPEPSMTGPYPSFGALAFEDSVDLSAIEADITALQSDVTTAQSDISTAQSDIAALQGDVAGLGTAASADTTDFLASTALRVVDFSVTPGSTVSLSAAGDPIVASCSLGSAFASGDLARFNAVIEVKNSSGVNRTYTPKVKLGSSATISTMSSFAIATGGTMYFIIDGFIKATGSATQRLSAKAATDATNIGGGRYVTGTETTSGLSIDFTVTASVATGTQTAEMVMGMCTIHRP